MEKSGRDRIGGGRRIILGILFPDGEMQVA